MTCQAVMIEPVQILSLLPFLIVKRTIQGMSKSTDCPLMILFSKGSADLFDTNCSACIIKMA